MNSISEHERLKQKHPDVIILIRADGFYEAYNEDAKHCAECLSLTTEDRAGVLVCSFPHYALDSYLPKMVHSGMRIAICDPIY